VAGDYEDYQIRVGLLKEGQTPLKYHVIPDSEIKNLSIAFQRKRIVLQRRKRKKGENANRLKRRARDTRKNEIASNVRGRYIE
jgi:hypothetical protein